MLPRLLTYFLTIVSRNKQEFHKLMKHFHIALPFLEEKKNEKIQDSHDSDITALLMSIGLMTLALNAESSRGSFPRNIIRDSIRAAYIPWCVAVRSTV